MRGSFIGAKRVLGKKTKYLGNSGVLNLSSSKLVDVNIIRLANTKKNYLIVKNKKI